MGFFGRLFCGGGRKSKPKVIGKRSRFHTFLQKHLSRFADTELRREVIRLTNKTNEIATAYNQHVRDLTEGHESAIQTLNKQLKFAQDATEIKERQIAQLAEIIERDRERVRKENAAASREIAELQSAPNPAMMNGAAGGVGGFQMRR